MRPQDDTTMVCFRHARENASDERDDSTPTDRGTPHAAYWSTLQVPIRAGKIPVERFIVPLFVSTAIASHIPASPTLQKPNPLPRNVRTRMRYTSRCGATISALPDKHLPRDAREGDRVSASGAGPSERMHASRCWPLPPTHVTVSHAPSVSRSGSSCRRWPTPSTLSREVAFRAVLASVSD